MESPKTKKRGRPMKNKNKNPNTSASKSPIIGENIENDATRTWTVGS